ncbi:PIN domain-containing protein [Subsaximicrobium wynnwilliamsii]|uniref:PIN domain-containing protein n=1 Tax=Subsaximicrobium wynnwilliamsii TaxID=291179 RepID=A0A5C6ZE60_9FLAO|nr:PIN domain-containing protein [Subsaximicrobium wynnwilliamsii]TXD82583.1 PIN domain-containing protein [Subsaximicrobium wynnwilliamsii]TXD88226.1 PIN domain-containing protein [Subsaximicrobium wynnwilliamsii]TXE02241.1 PIN domain-containing protein [Subsaximicrobium wynnwilliamsii]
MKNRLFIDTNIMLDFLGERHPFYEPIAKLATLADKGKVKMLVSPISFATVNYFLAKSESSKIAKEKLRKFKIISEICKLDEQTIEKGLNSPFKDFEDSLQYFSAVDSNCDIIITRNGKDFKKSLIPVMTAEEYLNSIRTI